MNQSRKFFRGRIMTKSLYKSTGRVQQRQRSGMTLIELLVAVSILVIIAAILVPQLRFASADRNIREASRMVASLFAEASQRAINDGVAGVVIDRNPNIEEGGVAYAGTSMFILREIPRYTGDDETAMTAGLVDTGTPLLAVLIPLPREQEDLDIIRIGDQISFGDQTQVRFLIAGLNDNQPGQLTILFEPSAFGEPPINPSKFIIHRQPRRLVSSRIDLPTGYLVDLRCSGEVGPTGAFFAQAPDATGSVSYIFNGRGSIDRFFFTNSAGGLATGIPTQPAYLMVREYNPDEGGELVENVLSSERQMWVTVEPTTGAANVISGVGVDTSVFTTLPEALAAARQLGSQGQAAQ